MRGCGCNFLFVALRELQHQLRNQLAKPGHVAGSNKVEFDPAKSGKPEFQLAIQIQHTGSF